MKEWGGREFWGCGEEWDPDWMLTDSQKKLRDQLMELCRTTIRPRAVECDRDYTYPRESLDSLASLGLLGLVIPKELGGLGENHVCCAMVVETIARYGCPSTALIYSMHLLATSMLLFRHKNNPTLVKLLEEVNQKKMVGTTVHSDPATGGHFWFPLTSKAKIVSEKLVRYLKYGAWVTSAGHADFYLVCTVSPDYDGDHANMVVFLCYRNELRAFSEEWSALGMHGNMSGQVIVDCELPKDRMVGQPGDGGKNNEEAAAPLFSVAASACWTGIALACMDVAKRHVTRKALGDVGMRLCDYATIQDMFGRSLCDTSACRLSLFTLAKQLDSVTGDNDWTTEREDQPRAAYTLWLWQVKHNSSETASAVADLMLKACGGTGYKTELGLERLLRDSKAGAVMAPTNEVIRSLLGQAVLLGPQHLDLWSQKPNSRILHQELSKMSLEEKKELGRSLLQEGLPEPPATGEKGEEYDDFDNPFSRGPPTYLGEEFKLADGSVARSALSPSRWTALSLLSRTKVTGSMTSFKFGLPARANHSGLLAGQYVKVRVRTPTGESHERYLSPVSLPENPTLLEVVLRFESHGIVSQFFQDLKSGDTVEVRGPCGGFEYHPRCLSELTLLASGGGVTPGLQLVRTVMANAEDTTRLKLIYYCDTEQEILYKDELDAYAARKGGRLEVCYSLGEAPQHWTGEEGFLDGRILERHVSKDSSLQHKVLLCGGPNMTLCCCYALKTLGLQSSQLFLFGQFGAEQIKKVFGRNARLGTSTSKI